MTVRSFARVGLAAAAATLGLVGLTGGAVSAHVTIAEPEHVAGQYTLLTFGVPHGCDGSPTREVRIQIPVEIPQVTPTVNPNWDVEKVMEELDEPIEGGHGAMLTERVAEVVYTAKTPLPDDLRDAFELSLKAPDLPGETLYFPTIQTCVEGEHAWVELPTADVPASELDEPAPSITLIAGEGGDDHGATADDADETEAVPAAGEAAPAAEAEPAQSPAADVDDDSDNSNTLSVVALIVGAVGVILGGASLAIRRRPA